MWPRWDQRMADDLRAVAGVLVLLLACWWSVRARDP